MPPVDYIIYVTCYNTLTICTFLIGWYYFRRDRPLVYKALFALSGLTCVVELVAMVIILQMIPNFWLYNSFTPVECGALLYVFYKGSKHVVVRRLNVALLCILPLGIIVLFIHHPSLFKLNSEAMLLYLFLEWISAAAILIDVLVSRAAMNLIRQPLIWLATGILSYSSIFSLLYIMINYFFPRGMYRYFILYSSIANAFMYSGFIGFFVCYRRMGLVVSKAAGPAQE